MKNILKNYQEDIIKSTKTSLLIELNSNDLKFFDESIEKNTYFQDENFVFNLSILIIFLAKSSSATSSNSLKLLISISNSDRK